MMDRYSEITLDRVVQNDRSCTELWIGSYDPCEGIMNGSFTSSDSNDFSVLGTAIGNNTHLTCLHIELFTSHDNNDDDSSSVSSSGSDDSSSSDDGSSSSEDEDDADKSKGALDVTNSEFFDGLRRNTSIHELFILGDFCITYGVCNEILRVYQEKGTLTHLGFHNPRLDGGAHRFLTTLL